MPVPLQVQQISSFLGLDENISDMNLPEVFSSGGSKNVWMDKFGRVRRLDGHNAHNVVVANAGLGIAITSLGSPCVCLNLIPFNDQIIGRFKGPGGQVLAYTEDFGYTWTSLEVVSGAGSDLRMGWAILDNVLYLIFPNNGQLYTWDGTTLTEDPGSGTSPAVSAAASSPGNLVGTYRWKLVSVSGADDRSGAGTASTALTISNTQASLTWTADTDVSVQGYELYRTTGTGNLYYFVTYIDGRTTAAYTDNALDSEIFPNRVLEEHGETFNGVPGFSLLAVHKQRLWYGRTGYLGSALAEVYWSDPGQPLWINDSNKFDIGSGDTLETGLRAMVGDFEDSILFFTEKSIYRVTGTGQVSGDITDWNFERTKATIGTVSPTAWVKVPAGAKYRDASGQLRVTSQATVAFFSPLCDVRAFDGTDDEIISFPVKETLDAFAHSEGFFDRFAIHAIHDLERQEVIWAFPLETNASSLEVNSYPEITKAVVWNYRWGVWYVWDHFPFTAVTALQLANDAHRLFGAIVRVSATSRFAWLHDGNTFDGTAIDARWMTKPLYGAKEEEDRVQEATPNLKRWRWADILVEVQSQDDMPDLEWYPGVLGNTVVAPYSQVLGFPTDILQTADGDYILTSNGDYVYAGQSPAQARIKLVAGDGRHVHSEAIRLKVSSDHTDGAWIVSAINLAYQVMPGLRRRFQ